MKNCRNLFITTVVLAGLWGSKVFAEPSENFKVFLCFGQSNMSGGSGVPPEAEDMQTNPRIFTLAFNNCPNYQWQKDGWYLAKESLHCGDQQDKMGPAYAFGRAMADSLPNDTIGLIPCGQWGVSIEHFMKDSSNKSGNKPNYPGSNAYQWMENRCKKAIERGVFSGIVLVQGTSNYNDTLWPAKVKIIFEDLKSALGFNEDLPFVAGEIPYTKADGNPAAGQSFNPIARKLPNVISNAFVASAEGLGASDQYHFNRDGYLTLGQRMAVEMMKGLHAANLITGTRPESRKRIVSSVPNNLLSNSTAVYTLSGRLVSSGSQLLKNRSTTQPGNMYIVANKTTGKRAAAKLMIAPTGR